MKKICEYCGIEFETDNVNKRFCTRQCKDKSRRKRVRQGIRYDNIEYTKVCIDCGREFITTHNDKLRCDECRKMHKLQKSKEYRDIHKEEYSEYQREYRKTHKYIQKYTHKCLTCGKEFENTNKNTKYPYCTECVKNKQFKHICKQCGAEFISDKRISNICDNCIENSKLKECVCKICGKTFMSRHKSSIFCSDECRKISDNLKAKKYRNNPITRHIYKESQTKSKKKRLKEDMEYKIKCNISISINKDLKKEGVYKNKSTKEYLLDSIKDIKEHLEKQFKPDMNWENHGTLWHIDHIRPQASFKFINDDGSINEEAIQECWKKENLQPLYKEDNISKGSRYNGFVYKKGEVYTEDKWYKK